MEEILVFALILWFIHERAVNSFNEETFFKTLQQASYWIRAPKKLIAEQRLSKPVNNINLFKIAHHIVDMCEELLDEIPQPAQVHAGISLSVCSVSLSPSNCFFQPKVQLLDA